MKIICGYKIRETLRDTVNISVYRGHKNEEQNTVIIKMLKAEYPVLKDIAKFKREYEIAKKINQPGIVKPYALENYKNGLVLILEDFGGISLDKIIKIQKIKMIDFLNMAISFSDILGEIHKKNIIHLDINPGNIIINTATSELKITDFGISSLLSKEKQKVSNPNLLEGTLAYMSPEQTGRMNRDIDYRSDFYSLGVTFYEILTGKLPFSAKEPMELVHCHIAVIPISPNELNPDIPKAVSDIVMKLLSKTAEDRYQSAYGLKADLEVCLRQWQKTGKIENFLPGEKDISDKFQINQKLYGREEEIATLMAAFERVSQGLTEMMLVCGYSGVGKTALINEIHKPNVRQRGYFISGKFDQFQQDIPYLSITQAFQELIRQLLTESEDKISIWKEKLLYAFGPNGQIIIDVIPEVEIIIGEQPAVLPLPPTEAQNRFSLVFQNFVRVFTQEGNPLVIFLDDLQWADSATLKLLQLLITDPETRYLFLIGAYRDNEVSASHLLMSTIDEIRSCNFPINRIYLKPLDQANINHLIADTLHCEEQTTQPLAELVFNKTGGNPFFLNQFLITLYEDKLLEFDWDRGRWQWNLEQIQRQGITDNIVTLMVSKIQKLPSHTQNILKIAACIGNQFDLKLLSTVNEKSQVYTAVDMWNAVQEGLILSVNNTYKVIHAYGQDTEKFFTANDLVVSYRFLHDRVQQAAYTLIPEANKKHIHLQIGKLLLKVTSAKELEEHVFDIVNHLNFSIDLINIQKEKEELSKLNLLAGKKAKASTAYEAALNYLTVGIELLATNCWSSQYELTLALYLECSECEHICCNFERAEKLFNIILDNARTNIEKAKVYHLKIGLYERQCKFNEGLSVGLEGLKILGLDLPTIPSETDILQEHQKIKLIIGTRKIEDLVHINDLDDPVKNAIIVISDNLITIAYQIDINLFILLVLKVVSLSLEYGNSEFSVFLYSSYGLLLCGLFDDFESGYQFGQLALKISNKWNNIWLSSKANYSIATFINHWKKHLITSKKYFLESLKLSFESGNLMFVSYISVSILICMFFTGTPLDEVYEETNKYLGIIKRIKYQDGPEYIALYQQMILNLKGLTDSIHSFNNHNYNELQHVAWMKNHPNKMPIHWYFIFKMIALYIFDNYHEALKMAIESDKIISVSTGYAHITEHYLYYSLTLAALYSKATPEKKQEYWQVLLENQEKMKKWADNCPENFLHKYLLITAEIAHISNNDLEAMDLYEQAIASAQDHEYTQNQAIACELAAKFYLAKGKERIARTYMKEAHYGYIKWGATAKVKYLEEKYPQLLLIHSLGTQTGIENANKVTNTTGSISEALDFTSVIKASQSLASEIVLSKLLNTLIKVLVENAGAQKGFLILDKSENLVIEAAITIDKDTSAVWKSIPVETSRDVPEAIINYVKRTRQNVVLSNATQEGIFIFDAYIRENQPKSVLCMPILHQGKLIGILYLENNLLADAFTPNRLEVLNVLSSQAAISLENARLYESLEIAHNKLADYSCSLKQKVDERTIELKEKNEQLCLALHDLQQAQVHLVQSEKMSSLGQLVAGVAHEINNPVSFIYGNLAPAREYSQELLRLLRLYQKYCPQLPTEIQQMVDAIDLDFLVEDLLKLLSSMEMGAQRISQIVLSLRNFSHLNEADMKPVDIHEGIDSTLVILKNRLKGKGEQSDIKIIKEYGTLPKVECYAGQLNQVFMNILSNAIDTLQESTRNKSFPLPTIWVCTEVKDSTSVVIRIADNGYGMTEEVHAKLFDPFFTTKPVGKGTGLGLSISYQIVVEKHGGQLTCHSTLGQGAEFVIEIPIWQSRACTPDADL